MHCNLFETHHGQEQVCHLLHVDPIAVIGDNEHDREALYESISRAKSLTKK
jgi:hypothetical protein